MLRRILHAIKVQLSLEKVCYAFYDCVEGKNVYYFKGCDGNIYLKTSKWSFFYVKKETPND
jgi:hypothetical protein